MNLLIVIIQTPLRGKAGVAVFSVAQVWALPSVQTKVRLQVSLFVKGLATIFDRTDVVALAFVFVQMHL